MLNFKKIEKEYPKSFEMFSNQTIANKKTKKNLYAFFDSNYVRVFVGYSASGGFNPSVYRKYTTNEFKKAFPDKDKALNWNMKRIGIIQSYQSRLEAENKGFEIAFRELEFLLENETDWNLTISPTKL